MRVSGRDCSIHSAAVNGDSCRECDRGNRSMGSAPKTRSRRNILLRDFWSDSCRAERALGLAGVRQRAFRDSETRQRSLASNHGRYHDLGLRACVWPQSCRCMLFGARLPDGARHAALPHWSSPRISQVRPVLPLGQSNLTMQHGISISHPVAPPPGSASRGRHWRQRTSRYRPRRPR